MNVNRWVLGVAALVLLVGGTAMGYFAASERKPHTYYECVFKYVHGGDLAARFNREACAQAFPDFSQASTPVN